MVEISPFLLSNLDPLAYTVLLLLLLASVGVWTVSLIKTISLLRGLFLQKRAVLP